jgi:hypothetical protein
MPPKRRGAKQLIVGDAPMLYPISTDPWDLYMCLNSVARGTLKNSFDKVNYDYSTGQKKAMSRQMIIKAPTV